MGNSERRTARVLLLLLTALAVAGAPTPAAADQLAGTVQYNGAMGPVSAGRPILLELTEIGAGTVVTANGGTFTFNSIPAGTYTLVYVLDLNNDGRISVGEPGLIYNNRQSFPGDPVNVPGPPLTLQFNDSNLVPGVSGTATYTGSKGTVNNTSRIRVHAFSDPELTNLVSEGRTKQNGGRYDVIVFGGEPVYLLAFLDLNGDDVFDPGEPFQIYNHRGTAPGDPITPGPHQTSINLMFGDENLSSGGAQLSGTVQYSGSLGSVSPATPIRLFLFSSDLFTSDVHTVATGVVTTNGGSFTLDAPAPGNYYLAYELDIIPNSEQNDVNVGEPFAAYNHRITGPADPIALPRSGVALSFDDSGRLPGIGGTVTYTGSQFGVSSTSPLVVEFFTDPTLSGTAALQRQISSNGGRYDQISFVTAAVALRAFLDANNNGQLDPGEPFEIYNGKDTPPGDVVVSGPDQGSVDFEFGDVIGAACAGDCNGDHAVTVNELVKLVNIAFGAVDISACAAGDSNHDGQITVGDIVAGVRSLLNGCP